MKIYQMVERYLGMGRIREDSFDAEQELDIGRGLR